MNLPFEDDELPPELPPENQAVLSDIFTQLPFPIDQRPAWVKHCPFEPRAHQISGAEWMVNKPYAMLADEMGAGKTIQAIIAAQLLFLQGKIDRVVVLAPASVRPVWFDEELGELEKHLWKHIPSLISEYHANERDWVHGEGDFRYTDGRPRVLHWVISNYDFIGNKLRLRNLLPLCTKRTLLVCDESSLIKNFHAKRTIATMKVRRACGRVWLLNGTPIGNNPRDMYAQGSIMHTSILDTQFVYQFDARYVVYANNGDRDIIKGWKNLEDMQQRFMPFIMRRLKKDCLDLPEKLPPVFLTVPLSPATWKIYCEMRDELIAWIDTQPKLASIAAQAIVKTLRLSQITAGFIGGIEVQHDEWHSDEPDEERPAWMPFTDFEANFDPADFPAPMLGDRKTIHELGREKLDLYLDWLEERLDEDPNFKLLTWCRFRPELDRLYAGVQQRFPNVQILKMHGNQKKTERHAALRLLDPRTAPKGPAILAGTPDSGAMGHSFVAAHTVVYTSDSYSLLNYLQTQDRVHRPGQVHAVSYFHILATGPKGQKTIDHIIFKARQAKEDLATWTTDAWRQKLAA